MKVLLRRSRRANLLFLSLCRAKPDKGDDAFLGISVGATGPVFHYSDTWQLIINTGTTIVTFLMVFLIQNTQNRDGVALQAKLDELIRATRDARNELVAVERLPEEKVEALREEVLRVAAEEGTHG